MTVRYGNDLALTEYFRQIQNDVADLNACLRDGQLKMAFLRAHIMEDRLDMLKERLNDILYGRTGEVGQG